MTRLDDFDAYLTDAAQSWDCPGLAISLVKEDELIYKRAFGLRDVEENLPVTEDSRFALASVTKSFTAMSVALLVDEGLLEWSKPVR